MRCPLPRDPSLDVGTDGLVADPLPADYALRYPAGAQRGALSAVLRWLEKRAAAGEEGP